MSDVANWYSGKKILITGVTGFVGKVLVEKLLRSCPDIDTIFLFVRPKKGKTIQERKDSVFQNVFFDPIRSINPELLNKVLLMNAALAKDGLSLSPEDENTLINNCDIVFHNAARVQFDRGIHEICETNVAGLKNLLELCKRMKHLKAFVFCSTAFSQYTGLLLEEKGYDPPIEPEQLSQILDKFDEDLINPLTTKILGRHRNTYAFSKAIAEDICKDYNQYFPVVIARPSIVSNVAYDPLPGWTEGVNGFNGSGVLASFGVLKVVYGDYNHPRSVVPVDIVANGLILIGWQSSINKADKTQYFNLAEDFSTAQQNSYARFKKEIDIAAKKYPVEVAAMAFGYRITTNYIYFKLLDIWYHILTGLLLDTLLCVFGRTPMVMNVQRKLAYQMEQVQYYLVNQFLFIANNMSKLTNLLNDRDKLTYQTDIYKVLNGNYCEPGFLGMRKYLIKQNPESIPKAQRLQKCLGIFGRVIHAMLAYLFINYCYRKIVN